MPRHVYRVCRAVYARLDGLGAKRVGGRWNSPGRAVVYMAESISLAVIENLVHLSKEDFPSGYVTVTATIPDHVKILAEEELRTGFPTLNPGQLGDRWIASLESAVLRVRSAVIREEHNYLLNPDHPQFSEIVVESTMPFVFDERLFLPKGDAEL
jgi:RES domain-containing protein